MHTGTVATVKFLARSGAQQSWSVNGAIVPGWLSQANYPVVSAAGKNVPLRGGHDPHDHASRSQRS